MVRGILECCKQNLTSDSNDNAGNQNADWIADSKTQVQDASDGSKNSARIEVFVLHSKKN